MSWYVRPEIEREVIDEVPIWRLLGDWTRDLPLNERRDARAALHQDSATAVVVDLTDIKFLDSWGEETICDLLLQVHERHGHTAWVFDKVRAATYEGIRRALQRRGLSTAPFSDRAAAIAAFKSAP